MDETTATTEKQKQKSPCDVLLYITGAFLFLEDTTTTTPTTIRLLSVDSIGRGSRERHSDHKGCTGGDSNNSRPD